MNQPVALAEIVIGLAPQTRRLSVQARLERVEKTPLARLCMGEPVATQRHTAMFMTVASITTARIERHIKAHLAIHKGRVAT